MTSELAREQLALPEVPPLEVPEGFAATLTAMQCTLTPEQFARMAQYLACLLSMNEQMNLTAIREPAEAWTKHAQDALSLVPHLSSLRSGRVLDVGSGGGIPGIPLAIARPDLRFTLLEATQKKAAFLASVAERLGLDNVRVVGERAEDMQDELGKSFDVVTARAVARIGKLLAFTAPFAKSKGRLLFIKGQRADEELAEAKSAMQRHRCKHLGTTIGATGRVVALQVG